MTVKDIMDCITSEAPLFWQEDYDNAGLQIGDENAEIHKVLITLDVTEAVVKEAIAKQCDMIVSHHPLLFHGLKQITPQNATERMVMEAIKALPDRQREILWLRTVEGLSYEEISDRLGMTPFTLRVLLTRARSKIKSKV